MIDFSALATPCAFGLHSFVYCMLALDHNAILEKKNTSIFNT